MELDYEHHLSASNSNADFNTEYQNMMMIMTMILHQETIHRDSLPTGQFSGRSHVLHNKIQAASPKRRKELQKRRVCVSALGSAGRGSMGESYLPDDMWAWRKYGQKPIKGSPHPRGYYRCSSSKGCPARKQVEKSQTDWSMLLITYTFEHNHPFPTHRNALAGSTRHNLHPPTNTITTALVEEELPVEANREVQISPSNQSLVEKETVESPLLAEENYPQSIELQNYLLSELQDFDEEMSIYSHMGAFIERVDYEEDEAVLMEETSPIDPYNLFEWSSSPHLN